MSNPHKQTGNSLEQHLAESLNIFQASMTMLSIFTGFVFSALLQLLSSSEPIASGRQIVVRILLLALGSFLVAIFSFHHCAHRVARYWQVFLPQSVFVRVGGLGLIVGVILMLSGLSALLWEKNMENDSILVLIGSFALGVYILQSRRTHATDAPYLVDVDSADHKA